MWSLLLKVGTSLAGAAGRNLELCIAAREVKFLPNLKVKFAATATYLSKDFIYIIFNYLTEKLIRLTVMSQPTEALQVKSRPRINNKIKFN